MTAAVPFKFTASDGETYSFNDLTLMSAAYIRNLPGVGWYTFRLIIRVLHAAGLKPWDYVEFGDSLELLNLPIGLYRRLRSTKFPGANLPDGQVQCITDLTRLDVITVSKLLRPYEIEILQLVLSKRGLDFAPLFSNRTIQDVFALHTRELGALGAAGLRTKTRLTDLTTARLNELKSGPVVVDAVALLKQRLAELGVELSEAEAAAAG